MTSASSTSTSLPLNVYDSSDAYRSSEQRTGGRTRTDMEFYFRKILSLTNSSKFSRKHRGFQKTAQKLHRNCTDLKKVTHTLDRCSTPGYVYVVVGVTHQANSTMKSKFNHLKKTALVCYTSIYLNALAADHTVAITILAEAGNQSEAGQTAVMAVIAQRAIERGITHKQVCLERKQFSCWIGKSYSDLEHLLDTPQAKHALWLEANADRIDLTTTKHANHYHAIWMQRRPYWARHENPLYVIGDHAFYRL